MLEKSKTYYRDNREKMVQWHRTYYAKHNKEENARVTKWRNDNLVKAKEQEAKYRHSDARKIVARNYRHKRRAQEGKGSGITNRQWNDILKMYNFRCAYCGIQGNMTIDHVIPLSKGGEHSIENIVPACVECNCRKNASLGWKPLIYKKAM
jgi:5-methylcytosine-specific restriction endonuclease McrA